MTSTSITGRLVPLLLFGCVAALSGCAPMRTPDLERLYGASAQATDQPPVILIPGILGSRLRDTGTGEEVWPGGLLRLLLSRHRSLALEIDPQTLRPRADNIEAYAITDKAAGQDFYNSIIRTLEGPGAYGQAVPGVKQTGGTRHYYIFYYDWRQDNVRTVKKLDALIEQIRRDHGKPDLKVDIIAHSMGGLITRYYIRYGTTDVLDDNEFPVNNHGAERIRRVILLGTPNLGSVKAVQGFIDGFQIGLRKLPTEVLATMPSTYQLFPHALHDWLITSDGEPLERDLFEARIWRRFRWSVFDPEVEQRIIDKFENSKDGREYVKLLRDYFGKHLERARRFTWSLTVDLPEPKIHPIVFGGDCDLTPARILVEEVDNISMIRLWPDEVTVQVPGVDYNRLMLEPGDGTVTKASLLARESLDPTVPPHEYFHVPLDYAFFLCEKHYRLTTNISFKDNVLHALLNRDVR